MEFLHGGELFFHLKKRGLILEKEVQFYLGEMTLAIEFVSNYYNLRVVIRNMATSHFLCLFTSFTT